MTRPNNSVFIVFEGLDGSGKSTCAKRTAELLGALYLTTPSGALRIHREDILDSFSGCQEAAQLMYLASVANASHEIHNLLHAGQSVVLDRYVLSTQVYAEFRGSTFEGDTAISKILTPANLTVYLDAPLSARRDRVHSRSSIVPPADEETLSEQANAALRAGYFRRFSQSTNGKVLLLDSSLLGIDEIAQIVADECHNLSGECK